MRMSKRSLFAGGGGVFLSGVLGGQAGAYEGRHMRLSSPSASSEAASLYKYLWDIWGHKTLTGQQESTWVHGADYEMRYVKRVSGKLPAIRGLDYLDPKDNKRVNRRAQAWYNKGGIPTICWHWGNPLKGPGYESSKTDFNAPEALKAGTSEQKAMMRDLAEIADLLTDLRDAKVPVLWRPLHEFTGDWFWWGKHGPETFKLLWITMYEYFTTVRGLNNLIWVLGYTKDPSEAYFPGEQYVDIVGADNYVDNTGSLKDMFDRVVSVTGRDFPIALHENGPIPDPSALIQDDAQWLWFLTWHSQWITGDKFNTPSHIKAVYNSERYITLDELPDLRRYGRG